MRGGGLAIAGGRDSSGCGGGVTDKSRGVAWPEVIGDCKGDIKRGEYWPNGWSDAPGELAVTGLLSTSFKSELRKVERSSCLWAAA